MENDIATLFDESRGSPIMYQGKELRRIDMINLPAGKAEIRVSFISSDSNWRQGIILATKGSFEIEGENIPYKTVLWEDTAPRELMISINSKDKILDVYNVWETEDGTVHWWYNGGAMHVEEHQGYRIYNCNDGYPDDDLNDLIFKIEFLSS